MINTANTVELIRGGMHTSKAKVILLVEDEFIIAVTEKKQLEAYGYAVKIVSDGEAAVQAVKGASDIDLILMDINLGSGIDGTEAAGIILKDREIPIVFVSSHIEPEIVEKTEKITSYGYVVKNSSITVLDASIKMAFKLFEAKTRELKTAAALQAQNKELIITDSALRESEERFQLLFDEAPLGYQSLDIDGNFIEVNQKWLDTLGYRRDEVIGKWFGDFLPPAYQEGFRERFPIFKRQGYIHSEFEMMHKSGRILFIAFEGKIGRDLDNKFKQTHCILQDITERRKTEEALRQSERKYRHLHESIRDGIVFIDLKGFITSSNSIFQNMLGYTADELLSMNFRDITPDKWLVVEEKLISGQLKEKGFTDPYEKEYRRKDGSTCPVELSVFSIKDENNITTSLWAIVRDITERKQIENILRESEEKNSKIFKESPYPIMIIDTTNGCFIDVNEAMLSNLNYSKEELIGKSAVELGIILPEAEVKTRRLIAESGQYSDVEVSIKTKMGKVRFGLATGRITELNKHPCLIQTIVDITERKRVEEELKESEDRFKALHNASFGGIAIHDKGIILDCNNGLSEMTGYSESELTGGMDGLMLISEKSKDDVRNKIRSGYEKSYEATGLRKNGDEYPLRIEARNVLYKGKQVRVVEFRDITEQKRMEKELRESEERFRCYISNAPDGVMLVDENGKYTEVNQAACEMTGYSEKELLQKSIIDLTQKIDLKKGLEHFKQVQQEGSARGDFGFITKSGEIRFWNVAAVKLSDFSFLAFTKDITDQKNAQLALKENEEKYRFALEGSNLGEWDWDYKTGKVNRNARWAEMLGYSPLELEMTLQQGIDLMHPDDIQMVEQTVTEHIKGIGDHYYLEYRLKTKNGNYKWIRDCGKIMVRDTEGNPVRLCGTHEDIDDRKRSRDKIDSLLAEKELLLKEVHHRIKNNMNSVSGMLALQERQSLDPSVVMALSDARNRIQSMSMLYDKLYRSQDYDELSIKNYISSLVDEAIANFPSRKTVKVIKDIQDFVLDVKRLQSLGIIINELITNIMKYAFIDKDCGNILVSVTGNEGRIKVCIRDDGIGIPATVSFENSTGFGLQLVHALTQQLDGSIQLERGEGTKVSMEFSV